MARKVTPSSSEKWLGKRADRNSNSAVKGTTPASGPSRWPAPPSRARLIAGGVLALLVVAYIALIVISGGGVLFPEVKSATGAGAL